MNVALRSVLLGALFLCGVASSGWSQSSDALPPRTTTWSDEALDVAAHLPVQDGGRVKPLSTFANFTLLRISGRRTAVDESGERIDALSWLLDVLVDPDRAARYPVFQVQDSGVVRELGLDATIHERRDRWSFEELRPGVPKLFELAHRYSRIEANRRSPIEQQIVMLAEAVDMFIDKATFLDFARAGELRLAPDGIASRELGGVTGLSFAEIVRRAPEITELRRRFDESGDPLEKEASRELGRLLGATVELARSATKLALQPPDEQLTAREEWHTPGELFMTAYSGRTPTRLEMASLEALQRLGDALGNDLRVDHAAAEEALVALSKATRPLADARGEIGRLDLEVTYYRLKLLFYSLVLFVAAFLATAVAWLRPNSRVLYGLVAGLVSVSGLLLIAAIVLRCIIRARPPVSTLYETLLFVTAVGVLIGLFIELVNKKRIALWATAVLGMVGLFLANGYETLDAKDTMPTLVAVLDTNFWLATHVTTIVAGYAAGMFAALLGSIYVIMRVIRKRASAPKFFTSLGRMIYGTLCFALILSLVGTILGGIWANDSWGRFWGWDPKENGALLICISQVAILHSRLGGYLRELGTAVAAAFAGTIVAFSWFGTNLLGVGLHSYGFTSGINSALWSYYGLQWGICSLGLVAWARDRRTASAPERPAAPVPPGSRGREDLEPSTGSAR